MSCLITIFLILGIIYFALQIYQFLNITKDQSIGSQPGHAINIPVIEQQSPEEDKYWDGPTPTEEQRRQTLNRLTEFFKQFPESKLKEHYPKEANMAAALKRYQQLEQDFKYGCISEQTYNEEVEKLLPLIDISEDLPPAEK